MTYIDEIATAIRDAVDPKHLPDGDTDLLFRFYALLALTDGEQTDARGVHDAWSAWMSDQDANHDAIVPFDNLDPSTRSEDQPFVNAIRRAASDLEADRQAEG